VDPARRSRKPVVNTLLWGIIALATAATAVAWWVSSRRLAHARRQVAAIERLLAAEPLDDVQPPGASPESGASVARDGAEGTANNLETPAEPPGAPPGSLELLHALSHDLRALLAGVLGYQELLADGLLGPLEERSLEAVGRIGTAASQLQHLLDAHFALAYARAGAPALSHRPVALGDVLHEALRTVEPLSAEYGLALVSRIEPETPYFETDARLLQRAMELAMAAAVRDSAKGSTLALTATTDDHHFILTVEGTALRQDDDSSHVNVRFTLARQLFELLGGRMDLAPAPDGSTTVRVRLPGTARAST
jgi:signal transduction histidine kinase